MQHTRDATLRELHVGSVSGLRLEHDGSARILTLESTEESLLDRAWQC